jgi:hypothetical protein
MHFAGLGSAATRTGRVATAGIRAELIRRLNIGRGGGSRPIAWRFGFTGCPPRLLGGSARCASGSFRPAGARSFHSPGRAITVTNHNPVRRYCSARCRVALWHARNKPKPPQAQQQSITLGILW